MYHWIPGRDIKTLVDFANEQKVEIITFIHNEGKLYLIYRIED